MLWEQHLRDINVYLKMNRSIEPIGLGLSVISLIYATPISRYSSVSIPSSNISKPTSVSKTQSGFRPKSSIMIKYIILVIAQKIHQTNL